MCLLILLRVKYGRVKKCFLCQTKNRYRVCVLYTSISYGDFSSFSSMYYLINYILDQTAGPRRTGRGNHRPIIILVSFHMLKPDTSLL
jgi:hypothetical protein